MTRQSNQFTCKANQRREGGFQLNFYSADNKRFQSMASVARYLNLSVPSVSPYSPSKEKICAPKLRLDANKKMNATQKKMHVEEEKLQLRARMRDVVVKDNGTKKIGEVGYKFRKQFGSMGWFNGTVVEIFSKSYLRRCVYTEDGDVEDLTVVELVKLAKLDKKSTVSRSKEKVLKKKNQASAINQTRLVVKDNGTKKIGEVGYKFRKQFGSMGWFTGTVVEIIPKSYLRRCVYTEDGDVEDLTVVDLVRLAKLDKKSRVSSNQSKEKVLKKTNQASVINQTSSSLTKKRKRIVSTSATREGIVATSERPTMRKTNKFRTKFGKKTGEHCTGRCRCKDCEGKVKGVYMYTSWVCSACTRDSGVDPKQWWLCSHEKRPKCWIKHCRDKHVV